MSQSTCTCNRVIDEKTLESVVFWKLDITHSGVMATNSAWPSPIFL